MSEQTSEAVEPMDAARKIWLAGVGAYGRVFDEAQGQIGKLSGTASSVFEDLVSRGAQVETSVRDGLAQTKPVQELAKLAGRAETVRAEQTVALEERVTAVRKGVTEAVGSWTGLFTLNRSMDTLLAKVDALTTEVAELRAAASAKEVAAKSAAKAAAKAD